MSSDVHIWHLLREQDEEELKKIQMPTMLCLCASAVKVLVIVDCGTENKKHGHHASIDLYNPRRKNKSEKQNSPANMVFNAYLSKVRWKDEQAHQNVWLAWGFLRGRVRWRCGLA
eukprot:TRINITY_DN480_c0_g1_i3.p1 TRINITY_DN480_c0_g1~~TRINITY_DN480_c0_g1_i3.p1  ORF type:complete len:115 (-),score=16.40 TRINITY_DN480_c0_g1_i3:1279-1623(-)